MPRFLALLVFSLLATRAAPALAASFDCAKAATRVEKQVCADPALSSLDEALANEYRAALAQGDEGLKSSQLAWLKRERDACTKADCLRQAYEARIEQLRGGVASFDDLGGATIATCTSLAAMAGANATDCRVTASGQFGKLGEDAQAYAVYCLDPAADEHGAPCEQAAVALFWLEPRTGKAHRWLQRVDTQAGGDQFAAPELLPSKAGMLLYLPVSVPGTGAFKSSALYRRQGTRWIAVDATGWEQDFAAKLPKGLAVWKGIWPDWRHMQASTGLYRAKDANCCATGGSAQIELALQGNRVELVSYKILPARR